MTKKRYYLPFALSLLFFFAVFTLSAAWVASAEKAPERSFKVAHLTDVHVFDKEYANESSPAFQKAENSLSVYYRSEELFLAALETVREQNADYLIVSGDLTADGGRSSHELVANALRKAQTEIRKNKPSFQIFVIPGNHDLYNSGARCYLPSEEALAGKTDEEKRAITENFSSRMALPVNLVDFYEIYQGLGYGSSTLGTVEYFYTSPYFYGCGNADYRRALAPNDPTEDEIESSESDPTAFDKASRAGGLSYIARMADGFTLVALDTNRLSYTDAFTYSPLGSEAYRFGRWTAQTSGDVSREQLEWAESVLSSFGEKPALLLGTAHHSLVPHTDMQDQITARFIAADYRTASYVLADLGVRYFFTGHVHANDVSTFVSQKGNVLYDIETPSAVCYGAATRVVRFDLFPGGAEKVYDSLFSLETIEGNSDVISLLDGKTRSIERLITDFYLNEDLKIKLKNKIAGLEGKSVGAFGVSALTVSLLQDLTDDLFSLDLKKPEIEGEKISFPATTANGYRFLSFAKDFESYLFDIDASLGKVEGGYKVKDLVRDLYRLNLVGAEYASLPPELSAVSDALTSGALAEKLVNAALDLLLPELEVLFDAPLSFSSPLEEGKGFDLSAYPARYENVSASDIGKLAMNLMQNNAVTSIRTLLMALRKFSENAIVKAALSSLDSSVVKTVLSYAAKITPETELRAFLKEELFDRYFTDALFKNLGSYANDILLSYASDATSDGTTAQRDGEVIRYSYRQNALLTFPLANGDLAWEGAYSYNGALGKEENPPTEKDGRLPEMISIAYGEDPYRQINVKWFIRPQSALDSFEASASYVRYWSDSSEGALFLASGEKVKLTMPQIDLGVLYLSSAKVDYEMHTATLFIGDFADGETVYFTVGSDELGWSKVCSFKKKAKNGSVTALAFSDIQGSVEENYRESEKNAEIALSALPSADLILNPGDNVDKEDNTRQWEYLLSHNANLFSHFVHVGAAGNHESGSFAMETYLATPGSAEGKSASGYYYSFDMENAHFTILNTNDLAPSGALSASQLDWLKRDLTAADGKWKIVVMHKGPYTAGSHAFDDDVRALRASLTPIFAEKGVSLVLQGHDHTYSVSEFIDASGQSVKAETDSLGRFVAPNGVLYLNLGTLGDKFYDYLYADAVTLKDRSNEGHFLSSPLSAYMTEEMRLELVGAPTFAALTVTENGIALRTYAIAGGDSAPIDEIEIVREGKESEIPAFSFKWERDLKTETFTSEDAEKQSVTSFYVTEKDGSFRYYKGYSIGEVTEGDYVSVKGRAYLASSCFVALYERSEESGEYELLSSPVFLALTPFEGKTSMPIWAVALISSVGGAILLGGAAFLFFFFKKKKKDGKAADGAA